MWMSSLDSLRCLVKPPVWKLIGEYHVPIGLANLHRKLSGWHAMAGAR